MLYDDHAEPQERIARVIDGDGKAIFGRQHKRIKGLRVKNVFEFVSVHFVYLGVVQVYLVYFGGVFRFFRGFSFPFSLINQ